MKFLSLAPVFLVGIALAAQSGPVFAPKVGQKATYSMDAKMDVAGNEAVLSATMAFEVKKVDEKAVVLSSKWSDLKVEVGGNPVGAESSDGELEMTPAMLPVKVGGGIEGSDPVQWFLVSHFIPPTEKELTPGLKYKIEVPEVKGQIPAYTYEGEFVGKEDLATKPTYKFKGSIKMKTGDLTSSMVVNVRPDGTVAKVVADFKEMDIPIAQSKANGKVTITEK